MPKTRALRVPDDRRRVHDAGTAAVDDQQGGVSQIVKHRESCDGPTAYSQVGKRGGETCVVREQQWGTDVIVHLELPQVRQGIAEDNSRHRFTMQFLPNQCLAQKRMSAPDFDIDDGALVQIGGSIVCGSANYFDAAFECLMIRFGTFKSRQK